MGKARRPQRANRPGAKRLRVRVKPHATRPRTLLTRRNLALVAGVCLVMLCLAQPTQCSRRRLPVERFLHNEIIQQRKSASPTSRRGRNIARRREAVKKQCREVAENYSGSTKEQRVQAKYEWTRLKSRGHVDEDWTDIIQ